VSHKQNAPAPVGNARPTAFPGAAISVIINERSGLAPHQDAGTRIQELFAAEGVHVRLERVRHGGDIAARARQAAARGDTLVAAGGDGTVGTVAGVAVEIRAVFGVLPTGTLNHFAKDLGIPLDLAQAVHTIVAGRVKQVDVGEVNGRVFVNNSSIGLYPRMVWARETEQRRGRSKWTAFAIAVLRTWRSYRMFVGRLLIDDIPRFVHTPFIFIGNNEYIAEGFNLGSRTALDRGRLSAFIAPAYGRFEILALPFRALVGRLDPDAHLVKVFAERVVVEVARPSISVALDGEVAIMRPPLRYRMRPGALRTMVPADRPK
jgi:diacylglycerol kinase family enzyme